ncbi:hypothetical protein CL630_03095 [bacterium]|nr:hypothetical protein [bacterium]|tara:strand:+ start:414 stop:614 length:201 start_codon:yes stop_codon:yes gene_type:complete
MATITILDKLNSRKKIKIEIDLNQWEKLADVFGLYNSDFLKSLNKSLKESKEGKARKIKSLRELRK